jgi:threonyl-tRNA synthetase
MKKESTESKQLFKVRHSLSHILAMAVLEKYPSAKLGIGPVIENGFYYDFKFAKPISDKDLAEIEGRMRELIAENLVFEKKNVTPAQAKKALKDQPYKAELIDELKKKREPITLYVTHSPSAKGDAKKGSSAKPSLSFTDLCAGPHVKKASEINSDAFRLMSIAGAYWRGDEKNAMLTRIYGLAFGSMQELEDYIAFTEEAKKRDHKKLGAELDLFTFSPLVGPGLPLWTPKGTLVRNLLDDYVWSLRSARGYEKVEIPHITKKDLYETSGHWQKFSDELFKITTREGHLFAMKPMNCPHHTQIYARKQWSYKELPQRYANTTMCYRDEQTGELSGLSRVRAFEQDDAHVFCRFSQTQEEFLKVWDVIHAFYGTFGFNLRIRLSTHDPKHPEKYLGDKKRWKIAESMLEEITKEKGAETFKGVGEAAFYGPKLDFMAKDSLGREWQVATIQLDMNMPERFDLSCINEEGKSERIVMIHAAIMGSIERFLSILIEHYGGAFPTWLSPVQAALIPISDKHAHYAAKLEARLRESGIRTQMFSDNETLGKRIREAEMQKIPFILVFGDKEIEKNAVNVRRYGKEQLGEMEIGHFISTIANEIEEKK